MKLDDYRSSLKDFKKFKKLTTPKDKISLLLQYATLAPSTHNTQPWLFKINKNSLDIFTNTNRRLPKADPTGRDLYISIGCCLENLIIAATFFRVYKSHKIFISQKGNLVAKISFKNLNVDSGFNNKFRFLVESMISRINVRGLFSKKPVDGKVLRLLKSLNKNKNIEAFIIADKKKIKKLADLTAQGLRMAHSDPDFRKEMSRWMNSSIKKRDEGIPTYSLRVPFLLSIFFPYLIKNFDMGSKLSKLNYISMRSASFICVISAKRESLKTWVEVGQLVQRMMLEINAKKARTSIFLASIEMDDLYKEVMKILNSNLRPQFLFCAGYMNVKQKYTTRVPVDDKLL